MADETSRRDTTGSLSRTSGVGTGTIRLYADLGLLEFERLPNGTRLFSPGQAAKAREIYAQRLSRRGPRPGA